MDTMAHIVGRAVDFLAERPYLAYSAVSMTAVWAFSEIYLPLRQRATVKTASLPADLTGVVDVETFEKARSYSLDNNKFGLLRSAFAHVQGCAFLLGGYLPLVWHISKFVCAKAGFDSSNSILVSVIFLNIDTVINYSLQLPWQIWKTFYIEERHGFNKQTASFFVKDQIKQLAVNSVLVSGIVAALLKVIQYGGDNFFMYAWGLIFGVSVALFAVYADYIAPLFDKFVPLPDGELRDKIEGLAERLKFPLTKLYVVKGSVRSSHSNAYFYGFFNNKRIVLFDTLLPPGMKIPDGEGESSNASSSDDGAAENNAKGCAIDEIVAVLSHELGHWSHNHVFKGFVTSQLQIGVLMYIFQKLYSSPNMYVDFGFVDGEQPMLIGLMLVLGYMLNPVNYVVGIIMTFRTRMFEYQADEFAKNLGYAEELRKALIKLNGDNLSFPVSDKLYSALNHSHPTLLDRLDALKDKKSQ